ncbi:YkvA family protein [Longispora urticae]
MDPTLKVVLLVFAALLVIALLVVTVVLGVKLVRMAKLLKSSAMPVSGKVAFWGALAYTIFPVDLLPDPIYLDDIGVLLGTIGYLGHLARKHNILPGTKPDAERRQIIDAP